MFCFNYERYFDDLIITEIIGKVKKDAFKKTNHTFIIYGLNVIGLLTTFRVMYILSKENADPTKTEIGILEQSFIFLIRNEKLEGQNVF